MSPTQAELAYKVRLGNAKIDAVERDWLKWVAEMTAHWSTPLPRAPGIYWTRTGGKTHTVEVVR